jgi:hypothetical protein
MGREQDLRTKAESLEETADAEMIEQWKSKYPRGVAIRCNALRAHAKDCIALAERIRVAERPLTSPKNLLFVEAKNCV